MPHGPFTPLVDGVDEAEAAQINVVYDALEDTYDTGEVDALIPAALVDLDTTVTGTQLNSLKTKVDGIETAADVTDAANVAAAGAVMESDTSTASMSFVVDEDDMSSNSATKVPTQQSVKAYVDASGGGGGGVGPTSLHPNYTYMFSTRTHGLGGGVTTLALSANVLYLSFFRMPHETAQISKVWIRNTTTTASGSLRVGLFSINRNSRTLTATLIKDVGVFATTAASEKQITGVNQAMTAGEWYAAGIIVDEAVTVYANAASFGLGQLNLSISNLNALASKNETYGAFAGPYTGFGFSEYAPIVGFE
jgi:hypothetical protein